MIEGRIAAMLDAHGIGWRKSRAELAAIHGRTKNDISGYDCVYLDEANPLLPAPLRPLFFMEFEQFDPRMPPTSMQGWSWSGNDAMANWKQACRGLEEWLGPGEAYDSSNTRGLLWREGAAEVRLICFPPHLQDRSSANEWHKREPRLATAASLTIDTGYLPPLAERERDWIAAFRPEFRIFDVELPVLLGNLEQRAAAPSLLRKSLLSRLLDAPEPAPPAPPRTAQQLCLNTRPREYLLEYVRDPPPGIDPLHGWAGKSADGTALVFLTDALWLVPMEHITGVHLSRIHPGRGSGYSMVELVCRNPAVAQEKRIPIMHGIAPEHCDRRGHELAAWLQRPLSEIDDVDC